MRTHTHTYNITCCTRYAPARCRCPLRCYTIITPTVKRCCTANRRSGHELSRRRDDDAGSTTATGPRGFDPGRGRRNCKRNGLFVRPSDDLLKLYRKGERVRRIQRGTYVLSVRTTRNEACRIRSTVQGSSCGGDGQP